MPFSGGDAVPVTHNGGFVAFEARTADGLNVYYTQTAGLPSPLWRISTLGGDPVKVLEGVIQRAFTVQRNGIYYIDQPTANEVGLPMLAGPGSTSGYVGRLRFFDFAAGMSRTIAADLGAGICHGLTASRDGRTVLFCRRDVSARDLMMVENFR